MIKLLDKFCNVTFSEDLETAVVSYSFGLVKFKYKVKNNPIYNKYLCNKAGFKTLLISRFGGIGDIVLFRSLIKAIRMSKKFSDYKIIFVSKSNYIDLLKKFDDNFIDYYIPIIHGRKNICNILKGASFNTYIDPADGLELVLREEVVKSISADEKWCNIGYFSYSDARIKGINVEQFFKRYFNKLFYNVDSPTFVRDVNINFIEHIIGEKINDLFFIKDTPEFRLDFKSKYVVVSPFSRAKERTYGIEHYRVIINYITDTINMPVVILGSQSEVTQAKNLREKCNSPDKIINLAGKLSYFESMFYIKNAEFLLGNETGTVHIAQDLGTKTICICNGSYMGTFQPYPEDITCAKYVYSDDIYDYLKAHPEHVGVKFDGTFEKITPQKVIDTIKSFI